MTGTRIARSSPARRLTAPIVSVAIIMAGLATPAAAKDYAAWATAVSAESLPGTSSELNTASNDGCPIESPDGLSLYTATNRPGGPGGIDIWVANRSSIDAPFGAPVVLPAPINSSADDFCPTPVRGKGLFFVSTRAIAGACGGADIYFARLNPATGWTEAVNLGCQVNSAAGEAGPSFVEAGGGYLYFSSGPDIYASPQLSDGSFGAAVAVVELNSAGGDFRPNVRKDGLEVVFDSNRGGTLGGQDIYVATRERTSDPWSFPVNAGAAINTSANETRASLSWDATRLYFGRTPGPEGGTDIYVSTR